VHPKVGTPQGGVISPLLANLYGERLDRGLDRLDLPFLRYADNLLVAYPSSMGEGEILAILTRVVPRGITLHKGKTQYLIGYGTLVTLGCVINRGGDGLKFYICEGYKQEAAPGKEARLQCPWANINYVKGALGWLRNLAIHFKHQYLEDRDRWARHVGLRRLYWMVEDSSGIKPGVYREVRLTGPSGIKVSTRTPQPFGLAGRRPSERSSGATGAWMGGGRPKKGMPNLTGGSPEPVHVVRCNPRPYQPYE
jgi:hypothetical protein